MIMMMMMIDDDDTEVQEVQVCAIRGGMIRVQMYKKYFLQIRKKLQFNYDLQIITNNNPVNLYHYCLLTIVPTNTSTILTHNQYQSRTMGIGQVSFFVLVQKDHQPVGSRPVQDHGSFSLGNRFFF